MSDDRTIVYIGLNLHEAQGEALANREQDRGRKVQIRSAAECRGLEGMSLKHFDLRPCGRFGQTLRVLEMIHARGGAPSTTAN